MNCRHCMFYAATIRRLDCWQAFPIIAVMCGRFTLRTKLNLLLQQFHAELRDEIELAPRYNIAPPQDIAVIRETDSGRELSLMRWGLIPSWTKEANKGPLLINARADTV